MSIQTTKPRAAAAQDAYLATINQGSGGGTGTVALYTGARPANLATPATGTLLSTCFLGNPVAAAFGATDNTTLIATGDTTPGWFAQDTSPGNTGTIGYWQLNDYLGAAVMRGSVGLVGSGADIEWNTLTVTAGVLVQILTMLIQIQGIT